ncbi:probable plastid-lipid-associated protein 13, chloroplastic [Solanum stenotomum]|uniref:probable plastid-lipid-associated protein 13, chloroplastic n=1 Tax=Solanum stenotomum TaxID=172797 RepID=UPI0020D1897B|nr:probable plastid-lipid-associated protein 13, chloroplastic [Solanum stenotomum]
MDSENPTLDFVPVFNEYLEVFSDDLPGPYQILRRVGKVVYELDFLNHFASVHLVFPVSMLKKCVGDPTSIVLLDGFGVYENLSYEEIPTEILDRKVKKLRNKEVASKKECIRFICEGDRLRNSTYICKPSCCSSLSPYWRIPSTLENLSKLDQLIRNEYGTSIAHMKLLNSIENKFVLSSKFSVEGPLRMKEEYVEGLFETPKVDEDIVPEQLKGALDQAVNTLQQLPVPIRDTVSRGLKIPLGEAFQRFIIISYLDEEILIVRNTAGEPEVLTRLDPVPDPEPMLDYES